MSRRRRALLLGGLALLLGGLAAFNVADREAALQRSVGGLVDVVVASKSIAAGDPVGKGSLAVRRVPERYAPDTRLESPAPVVGRTAAVDIRAGTDLTAGMVGGDGTSPIGPSVRRGERVAEVVALGSPDVVVEGSHVDVLVTHEPGRRPSGEAVLALEDIEVMAATGVGPDDAAAGGKETPGARVAASLRVSLRQAVYLAAAQDFARELRLLPRAAGDRNRGDVGLRMGERLP